MSIKYQNLDTAFSKLLDSWHDMPRRFREKYASARSKHLNENIGIGVGMKIKMLEEAGFRGVWFKEEERGGVL